MADCGKYRYTIGNIRVITGKFHHFSGNPPFIFDNIFHGYKKLRAIEGTEFYAIPIFTLFIEQGGLDTGSRTGTGGIAGT